MAKINTAPVSQLGRERIPVFGSFAPNGGSAVDASSRKGLGWSVARTAQGVFTITFLDDFVDLESPVATLQLAVAAARWCQVGTWTAPTATARGTLVIRVVDGAGAEQDIAANANNRISFNCWLLNTKSGPRRG